MSNIGIDWSLVKDLSNESTSQIQVSAIARITDSICLAGTGQNAQIWRSTDAGLTWTMVKDLSEETPSEQQICSIIRVTDSICLAGTMYHGQIWRSTDAGATWSLVKSTGNYAYSLIRVTDSICLAGFIPDAQIWRSTDAGLTWSLVKDLSEEYPPQIYLLSLARVTDSICLAGTGQDAQIWRSTDAGATWSLVKDLSEESPPENQLCSLARVTDSICLAGTMYHAQIWRSTDAGATWALAKDLSDESPAQISLLSIIRVTDSICLAGTEEDAQIWRSTDAGATWALAKDLSDESPAQISLLSLARVTDDVCLAGTAEDGQIWRSVATYEELDDFKMTLEAYGPKLDDSRLVLQAHDGTEYRDLSLNLAAYYESITPLKVINWNIHENRRWFIRLSDTGAAVSVEMYLTQADAEAQTNLQASGESSGYGSEVEVVLKNNEDASTPVSLYQKGYEWHLIVAGEGGAPKIFEAKEFVDLDEITHSIYRNSALITVRADAEIKAHTNARITRKIALGTHLSGIEVGDTARINSIRRGLDDLSQVFEHRIIGTRDSLVSHVDTVEFMELVR